MNYPVPFGAFIEPASKLQPGGKHPPIAIDRGGTVTFTGLIPGEEYDVAIKFHPSEVLVRKILAVGFPKAVPDWAQGEMVETKQFTAAHVDAIARWLWKNDRTKPQP